MSPADYATLREQLKRDEGLRLKPYADSVGKITIGYGRNLSDSGITQLEAADMLDHDIERHVSDLLRTFPFVIGLDAVRQIVLANMAFNMGVPTLAGFSQMWQAIKAGDYESAAREMLDSTWAQQVGDRAQRLASAMATGRLA